MLQETALCVNDTNIVIAEQKHVIQTSEFLGRDDVVSGAARAMNEVARVVVWKLNAKLLLFRFIGENDEDVVVIEKTTVAAQ